MGITDNDYFGAWVSHSFNSMKTIVNGTSSLGNVSRKLKAFGNTVIRHDFRHYLNKRKLDRIVMLTMENDEEKSEDKPLKAWITNGIFFKNFLDDMLKYGEITEEEHDNIQNNMDLKHVIHQNQLNSPR